MEARDMAYEWGQVGEGMDRVMLLLRAMCGRIRNQRISHAG